MITQAAILHLRHNGQSLDLLLSDLDIGNASNNRQITDAVANHLDVPTQDLSEYAVDRHETGNITVRPQAVFG